MGPPVADLGGGTFGDVTLHVGAQGQEWAVKQVRAVPSLHADITSRWRWGMSLPGMLRPSERPSWCQSCLLA